jgi:phage terminase large subunit-like protein
MVAFSLTQTEDLGYAVARAIVEESQIADDFDVGMERIMVLGPDRKESGKIVPLGGSPNARDGARTTFQFIDEVHLLHLPRLKRAVNVMQQNLYKRVGADAWMLTTTTAYDPGQGSVAEDDMAYAKDILAGKVDDPRMFYFHRQADDDLPLETPDDVRVALEQATGSETWSGDLDALVSHYFEPNTDRQYFQRVWLNQAVAGSGRAYDVVKWRELADPQYRISEGADITLGFDGARRKDATALIATEIETGFQQVLGIWERPDYADDDWEMPTGDIDEAVRLAFEIYQVALLFADPPYWTEVIDQWAAEWGDKRVISWWTNRPKPMAYSVRQFHEAILDGDVTNDGDELFAQHIGNTYRQDLTIRDEDDRPLWILRKERRDSENKIDAAMAATLSWDARSMALAKNIRAPRRRSSRLVSF